MDFEIIIKIVDAIKSVEAEDENFGGGVYTALKKLGYKPEQWRKMTKEQAQNIINKNGGNEKEAVSAKSTQTNVVAKSNEEKSAGKKTQKKRPETIAEVFATHPKRKLPQIKNGREVYKTINKDSFNGLDADGKLYKGKLKVDYMKPKFGVNDVEYDADHNGTLSTYINEKGEFTEQRQALHKQIIDGLFFDKEGKAKKPETGKQTYTFLGGGAGSGKSTLTYNRPEVLTDEATTIKVDCDAFKAKLPEYDAKAPEHVHEESSAVAKQAKDIAGENGFNVVDDGTGDTSTRSMRKKIAEAHAKGMQVKGVYLTTDIEEALKRNKTRARSVDENILKSTHQKVSEILPKIAKDFDDLQLYYTYPREMHKDAVLIATGGNGKELTPVKGQEELYNNFLKKKDIDYKDKEEDQE